jgi:endonuclease YncB( thermonuclease family)
METEAYVGRSDSLCVALGPSRDQWAEVRQADFYAPELHDAGGPEAKETLSHLVEGKRVECVADHRSYDRVVAVCRLTEDAPSPVKSRAEASQLNPSSISAGFRSNRGPGARVLPRGSTNYCGWAGAG